MLLDWAEYRNFSLRRRLCLESCFAGLQITFYVLN